MRELTSDLAGHAVDIAGSPEFVDGGVVAATALGAADDRIFVERYHPQSPAEVPPIEQLAAR